MVLFVDKTKKTHMKEKSLRSEDDLMILNFLNLGQNFNLNLGDLQVAQFYASGLLTIVTPPEVEMEKDRDLIDHDSSFCINMLKSERIKALTDFLKTFSIF